MKYTVKLPTLLGYLETSFHWSIGLAKKFIQAFIYIVTETAKA